MPQHEELSEQHVLAHLARARTGASLREIAHALGLQHAGRRELERIIARLMRKAEIEEVRNGRFRLATGAKPPAVQPARRESRPAGAPHAVKADANLISGRLVAHRDGYGFVVPDEPVTGMEGDLFIGRAALGDAMHGDRVQARIERRGRPGGDGRAEGRIVRILARAHATVVGIFRYGDRGNSVVPYEARILHEVVIPPGDELTPELREKVGVQPRGRRARLPELDGAVVDVELIRFPGRGVAPAGRVVAILGRPGDFGVDVEIIIRKHHLPHVLPDEVLEDAQRVARPGGEADLAGRQDFRSLPIVTIDGETARDFDDAVHVERMPGGHWQLQVHIADVSHYVRRGSALDREARLRGTSVYFPDRAVPMLPEALSNDVCSLKPAVERLVMSALMEMDGEAKIVRASFTPGVIRSAERMTYTNVNKVLEGEPEMTARYAHLAERFRTMRELALLLNARRTKRGSIDFDLPEPVIEFDELGRMVKIMRSERNIAHRIIEEFMLAANEAVAAYLERRGIASLHRVHEKPDAKKVLEFEELAHAFGYSLGVANLAERRIAVKHGRVPVRAEAGRRGRPSASLRVGGRERQMSVALPGAVEIDIQPQHYQRLTAKIAGKPEERILSYLMLRSLKQARYTADPLGHFALGFDQYTHFTSPIRRYPDLIVHRVLKWALEHPNAHGAPAAKHDHAKAHGEASLGLYHRGELEEIAEESSEAERRADGAERELMDWKTAQFMEQHLGEEYDALVTSVQKFGFFVELMETFVEGLVPINRLEELTDERCFFRERDHSIVTQRARRAWRLGDRLRVVGERIDPMRRRVEFAPVVAPARKH